MEKLSFYQNKIIASLKNISFAKAPLELYEPIDYILSIGGKRIRPSLLLTAYHMFDENVDHAINAALAVEVFHNFTLLHDDLMDKANVRRNKPTVHKKWNNSVAILSGDAMLIQAYELLFTYPFDKLKEIMQFFNKTALKVCEGQQYDMNFQINSTVTVNNYLMMIELKTAALIAASLKIGAMLAGAPANMVQQIYQFGKNIGIAFQLQDDLLDAFANEESFGKKIGGDILENKKTFLLLTLLEQATVNDKKTVLDWMERTTYDPDEKIKTIKSLYYHYDIQSLTERKIKHYFNLSVSELENIDLPADKKTTLHEFSELLFKRSS